MRQIALFIACLIGAPLLAETVQNIEFQFPPSQHEWRLLTQIDQQTLTDLEDQEREDPIEEEESPIDLIRVYTHREGDALETLSVVLMTDDGEEEEKEEETLAAYIQKSLNLTFGPWLPNHKFVIEPLVESENDLLAAWELNDGIQPVVHGYIRLLSNDNKVAALQYMTTAQKKEMNHSIWTSVLLQASLHN